MSGGSNPLAMSDEDFLKLNGPPEVEEAAAASEEGEGDVSQHEDEQEEGQSGEAGSSAADHADEESTGSNDETGSDDGDEGNGAGDGDGTVTDGTSTSDTAADDGADKKPAAKEAGAEGAEADDGKGKQEDSSGEAPDYAAFYNQIMAPFKANGKTITLKDPSEVIQLMQMGANYTKKLQDIQPHRKVLLMLQNNDLLDEGKLSFLIDLEKKDPEAIKKLVKDAGIDPMDIDTEADPNYIAGNHTVSEEEARFRDTLEELSSAEKGTETLQIINKTWDQVSKDLLWTSPDVMRVIHTQRENGAYALITEEMERQRVLGHISPNTPFLEAYKLVGDALTQAGAFGDVSGATNQNNGGNPNPGPQKLAERAAKPKPTVTNGDKASAASTTPTSRKKAEPLVNPLAMSDEEFMATFKNRL